MSANPWTRRNRCRRMLCESLEPRLVLDSTVVFNEIMYNPSGTDETLEWIELHNQMSVDVDISGWSLTDGVDYTFPSGTILQGGEYRVVAASPVDFEADTGLSGAFGPYVGNLSNSGEEIELRNHTGRLMDRLDYGDSDKWPVAADGSGASLAKINPQAASDPADNWAASLSHGGTPGSANTVLTNPSLQFNEVAGAGDETFFVELINSSNSAVSLSGYSIIASGAAGGSYELPNQMLASGELIEFDEAALGFRPARNEKLFLDVPGQTATEDAAVVRNRPRARSQQHDGRWQIPEVTTPGAENVFAFHDEIVINEIMYQARPTFPVESTVEFTELLPIDATWQFDQSNTDLGTAWRETVFDDSAWDTGQGLFFRESASLPAEKNTPLVFGLKTYYFRTTFEFDGDLGNAELVIRHIVDDGAVFYLNGVEVSRYNMPDGTISFNTLAASSIGNAGFVGPVSIPPGVLVQGTNVLAVETHQRNQFDPDIVFGAEVAVLAGITPSEPFTESPEEWVELFNRSDNPVDLSGWELDDAVRFDFPQGTTLGPGEYLVVAKDAVVLAEKYPGINIVGSYDGSLKNDHERIELEDSTGNIADEVEYFDGGRWPRFADAGGSSLELRDPFADNSVAEAWSASDESDRSRWQHVSYTMTVNQIVHDPPINFHEFVMGLLATGEVLIDNISVVANPDGGGAELIQNGSFEADTPGGGASKWRIQGTHGASEVIVDPDNPDNNVLRLVTEARMNYLSNHAETTLAGGARVTNGQTYRISYDAKWITGSPQLHTELYYKDAAATTILEQPQQSGTPGAQNSTFEANIGPTYEGLIHGPVVPSSSNPVTVSVTAADADGIASMDLRYSINGSSIFSTLPMTLAADGIYRGTIPAQSSGRVVQFYVEGEDTLGAVSTFPAAGADSRALYKVINGFSPNSLRHDFQLIMTPPDVTALHDRVNMMANNRLGSTVIYDGQEVFYDVGARLKGSMFSRQSRSRTGYNLRFAPHDLFRGVQETVAFDQNGEREILVKFMTTQAGNPGGTYDDVMWLRTPSGSGGGPTLTFLARHDVGAQFDNGDDGTLFKMEGIRVMTSTIDGTAEGLKIFQPIGWVPQFDLTDLGSDKELYRWPILINSNRAEDDYSAIIEMMKAFSLSGTALDAAINEVLDIEQWMQTFAMMSLAGIGDAYSQGNPHNVNFYVRPEDGKVLVFPWDWDFTFSQSTSAPLHGGKNIGKVISRPGFERIFQGQLVTQIAAVFNTDYMTRWASHFGTLLGENLTQFLSRISQRTSFVLSQLPQEVPFGVETGAPTFNTTTLLTESAPATALVPSVANGGSTLGTTWTATDFVESASWKSGTTGVGYENGTGYAALIGLDVGEMSNTNGSVFVRIPFNADDPADFDGLTLKMKYDDGFVAYLNGVRVASALAPAAPLWNSIAAANHPDSAATVFQNFDITQHLGVLVAGENILAIHGFNQAINSSDMLIIPELVASSVEEGDPGQTDIEVDTPFVTVDGVGWLNIKEIFLDGQTEPLEVTWNQNGWQTTVQLSPGLNELQFRAFDYLGNEVSTPLNTAINVTTTAERPVVEYLRVSEIMYHPADPTDAQRLAGFSDQDQFEFLELVNSSDSLTLDLSGVALTDGIDFIFANGQTLGPGEHVVIVADLDAFTERYGAGINVAGAYAGNLRNSGENLVVEDATGGIVLDFSYDDDGPDWYAETDGSGFSLVAVDSAAPRFAWQTSAGFRSSALVGGSPAATDLLPAAGDFDGSGETGRGDILRLLGNLGRGTQSHRYRGDLDGNGATQLNDLAGLQAAFGSIATLAFAPSGEAAAAIVVDVRPARTLESGTLRRLATWRRTAAQPSHAVDIVLTDLATTDAKPTRLLRASRTSQRPRGVKNGNESEIL